MVIGKCLQACIGGRVVGTMSIGKNSESVVHQRYEKHYSPCKEVGNHSINGSYGGEAEKCNACIVTLLASSEKVVRLE